MKRRALLAAGLSGAVVVAVADSAAATAQPRDAAAFIQGTAGRLTAIINGDESRATKAARLQGVVDEAVDTEEIAQFCLGRFWRTATPDQQKNFVQMFHRVLLEGVTGQISAYKGVAVTTSPAQERDDGTVVPSIMSRPGQKDVRVNWLVRPTPAGLRIEDVVAEGTSLRLTRRNDYSAYLSAHDGDVSALLRAMQARLEQT